MTKSELIDLISERRHLTLKESEAVVNVLLDEIRQELRAGGRVEIRGFGSFSVRVHKAREGRNPRTGQLVFVPEKKVVFFKTGAELRNRVNS